MSDEIQQVDLFIVGGGINGAAVARDAAGRGLKVMLAERGDYACATSSASSKLIHGGLRYLEKFEIPLVRESLREREIMLRIAPHLTRPLRFLVPITGQQKRPAWLVRIALLLYDFLSGRQLLAASGRLDRHEISRLPRLRKADLADVLHYADCWVDDARLVLETLLDARARGADIANRRTVTRLAANENGYHVTFEEGAAARTVHARFVVNAAGPWTNDVPGLEGTGIERKALRLVRGSHIVLNLPRPVVRDAYTLQNSDGRIVFTIPWLDDRFLVIGTTDAPQEGDPGDARCSDAERDYLLACYNTYFEHPDRPAGSGDIVWSWAGVRALVDDGREDPSKVTRSAKIVAKAQGTGGLISLYGGKLTTHRRFAEKIIRQLQGMGLETGPEWTATAPLHGGALAREKLEQLACKPPRGVKPGVARRWAFTYGSEITALYEMIWQRPELAREVVPGINEAELRYSATTEDARRGEDFLLRRTKQYLFLTTVQRKTIQQWFDDNRGISPDDDIV